MALLATQAALRNESDEVCGEKKAATEARTKPSYAANTVRLPADPNERLLLRKEDRTNNVASSNR
jgi:hypothetical protein